jgi:hypothetical protein
MKVHNHPNSSGLAALILLIGAAAWSITCIFSALVLSIVGYLLATRAACQALSLKKTDQSIEIRHNLMNYPDEISTIAI